MDGVKWSYVLIPSAFGTHKAHTVAAVLCVWQVVWVDGFLSFGLCASLVAVLPSPVHSYQLSAMENLICCI